MKPFRPLAPVLFLFVGFVRLIAANDEKPVLEFERLDLADKRTLRQVVVRSYDASSDRFLVVASGKALNLPANLLPSALAEQLRRAAPASGNTVTSTPKSPPPSNPHPPRPARESEASAAPSDTQTVLAHRTVAIDRVKTYYRYEFIAGSAAMRVDSVKIDAETTKPVPGWTGRYRTLGKAYLELFDTKGWSATRATSSFEVITEQKPDEPPVVIDFSRKS